MSGADRLMPELSTQPEPLVYVSICHDPDYFFSYAEISRVSRPFKYQQAELAQVPDFLMRVYEEAAEKLLKAQDDIMLYDTERRKMEKLEKERARKRKRLERNEARRAQTSNEMG